MTGLRIAADLCLPIELVTQSVGVYGIKGSGKTYAAKVFAEECVAAGVQIVVVDPTDAWYGLRSSAEGGEGLPVYVFGGEHGDVPLEGTAGELLADVVVEHGISAVLSLRHLRKGDQHRFVTAFAERLYHRKGEAGHRTPLHLIIDEAHSFAPQQVRGETARMVGAIEDLVRLGRSSGVGCTLISQRPASVNNNIRTQCETLICLRILAPHDRKALEAWIEAHDSEGQGAEFLHSLASLKTGEAWVWSPPLDLFQRVSIRRLRTFDSSATPKPGEARVEPERLADVDLDVLRERMAETIERQKAEDPKALRAEIARLARELAERPASDDAELRAEIAQLQQDRADLRRIIDDYGRVFGGVLGMLDGIVEGVSGVAADVRATLSGVAPLREVAPPVSDGLPHVYEGVPSRAPVVEEADTSVPKTDAARRAGSNPARGTNLSKAERAVLTVLAQYPQGRTIGQLALLAGYRQSGGFRNTLSSLRTSGYMEGGNGEVMRVTGAGLDALGDFEPLPTGRALLDYWINDRRLGKGYRAVLELAYDRYPQNLSGEEAARETGYEYSGGFRNILSWLRTSDLIEGSNSAFRASPLFFEGGS